jgi:hypothetical protein
MWKDAFGVPAVGFSLLPKFVCPVCSPGYSALLSALGVGFLASTRYLLPLTTVLIGVAVASLFVGASNRRGRAPFWMGVVASAVILFGKFWIDAATVTYVGVGLLVIASVWNAVPRKTKADSAGLAFRQKQMLNNLKADRNSDGTHD